MIKVMVMVMDDRLIVPSHFGLSHSLPWRFCKGWDSEAKRNDGRQGNNKLVHGFPPVVVTDNAIKRLRQKN
jgi:hypothetical protein